MTVPSRINLVIVSFLEEFGVYRILLMLRRFSGLQIGSITGRQFDRHCVGGSIGNKNLSTLWAVQPFALFKTLDNFLNT